MEKDELIALTKKLVRLNLVSGLIFLITLILMCIFLPLFWAPIAGSDEFVYVSLYSILDHYFSNLGTTNNFGVAFLAYLMPISVFLVLVLGLYLVNVGMAYLNIIEQKRLGLDDAHTYFHGKAHATLSKAIILFVVGGVIALIASVMCFFYYDLANFIFDAFDVKDAMQYTRFSLLIPAIIYIGFILQDITLVITLYRARGISEDSLDTELFKY